MTLLPPAASAWTRRRGQSAVFAIDEAERDGGDDRVEHRAERRHPERQHDRQEDERQEVVALPPRQFPERRQRDIDGAGAEPARVGFDHQEDGEEIEQRRDRRHDEHLQVRDLQELGDDERRGAQRRRTDDRADPGRREDRAAHRRRIARALQDRPRHRSERDRGGDAAARHRAEQQPRRRDRAPGAGAMTRPADGGQGPVDEERARARHVQDRAEDREERDVGGGDVERHAEDALERHVERADDARGVVSAVGDESQADEIEHGTVERVGDEGRRRHRQDRARRAPRRFQHESDQRRAEGDVDGRGIRGAIDEGLEVEDRPGQRRRRRSRSAPSRRAARARAIGRGPRGIEQETEHQRQEQERDAVDLRLDDADDPVQRVARQPHGQRRGQRRGAARQLARGRLEREILDDERSRGYCFHAPRSR